MKNTANIVLTNLMQKVYWKNCVSKEKTNKKNQQPKVTIFIDYYHFDFFWLSKQGSSYQFY